MGSPCFVCQVIIKVRYFKAGLEEAAKNTRNKFEASKTVANTMAVSHRWSIGGGHVMSG